VNYKFKKINNKKVKVNNLAFQAVRNYCYRNVSEIPQLCGFGFIIPYSLPNMRIRICIENFWVKQGFLEKKTDQTSNVYSKFLKFCNVQRWPEDFI